MSSASDHVVAALARLHSYASGRQTEGLVPLTVAISRQAGAGGASIARAAGTLLGWPVYDHELLTLIAKEKGLEAQLLQQFDERDVSWLEEMAASFTSQSSSLEGVYLKHLLILVHSLAKVGHCVIVGRGAPHLLPAATTLRVRVIAPRAMRVVNTEKRMGVSTTEAQRWVDKTDMERERFVRHHFQKDPSDPLSYDLMLNSGRYSVGECAALVVQAARLLEGQIGSPAAS
jgi:cytidylate kinase